MTFEEICGLQDLVERSEEQTELLDFALNALTDALDAIDRKQITLRVPEAVKKKLEKEAAEKGCSFNALMNSILWRFVRAYQRE